MIKETLIEMPGKTDINDQYTPGTNVKKSLAAYRALHPGPGGDYTFGEVTAEYYRLTGTDRANWLESVKIYPKEVRDLIKSCVVDALTHQDDQGNDSPIPIKFTWNGGPQKIVVTYDPSGPSYQIQIYGYAAPMPSPLAERRAKAKKK